MDGLKCQKGYMGLDLPKVDQIWFSIKIWMWFFYALFLVNNKSLIFISVRDSIRIDKYNGDSNTSFAGGSNVIFHLSKFTFRFRSERYTWSFQVTVQVNIEHGGAKLSLCLSLPPVSPVRSAFVSQISVRHTRQMAPKVVHVKRFL